jgi:hypothetical protein
MLEFRGDIEAFISRQGKFSSLPFVHPKQAGTARRRWEYVKHGIVCESWAFQRLGYQGFMP